MTKIACVVMCSGASRRFGEGDKLLASFRGKPLILHTLENLPCEKFCDIVVVTRSSATARLCEENGFRVILHDFPLRSDTIRLGLSSVIESDCCMFCVGDQPLCSRGTYARLVDSATANCAAIVRLCHRGLPRSPVIFPKMLYSELLALTGKTGGKAVISRHGELICDLECDSALEVFDVDCIADLEYLKKMDTD